MSGTIILAVCPNPDDPAAAAALAALPGARLLPLAAVFQAEPGLLWIEQAGALGSLGFDHLLILADAPLLLRQLGVRLAGRWPAVDAGGATSVPGVFAAGAALGVTAPDVAAAQAGVAARALAGLPPATDAPATERSIVAAPWAPPPLPAEDALLCACLGVTVGAARQHASLGPAGIAKLLGLVTGECRMAGCHEALAALCPETPPEAALPPLSFARPVPFAALAALAPDSAPMKPPQADAGTLA